MSLLRYTVNIILIDTKLIILKDYVVTKRVTPGVWLDER